MADSTIDLDATVVTGSRGRPDLTVPVVHRAPRLPVAAPSTVRAPSRRVTLRPVPAAPRSGSSDLVGVLGTVLAGVLDRGAVPADAHFFTDLGADSLVMARFCARVRRLPGGPSVAIQDVYQHPTLRRLAAALSAPSGPATPASTPCTPAADRPVRRASSLLCGTAQLACFLGWSWLVALGVTHAYPWLTAAPGAGGLYTRSLVVGAVGFAALTLLPVLAKWVLVGRWTPRRIPAWSPGYLRFWVVKTLVRTSPMVLLVGSPLYLLYLRALGARIGRGAVVLTRSVPVATDLLRIGDRTLVRKNARLDCYRAHAGHIEIDGVVLGHDVVVGEHTVLDIGSALGDGATLGHASSLHAGQTVPAGERRHGSPAVPTTVDHRVAGRLDASPLRRLVYSVLQLATLITVVLPLVVGGPVWLLRAVPALSGLIEPVPGALGTGRFYVETLLLAAVAVVGLGLLGLLATTTVPRLLAPLIEFDHDYVLYGVHYVLHRVIARLTTVTAFTALFGDASAIAHYLRAIGWELTPFVQTGSNFGMAVTHESPFASSVGGGTVVADGLSMMSAEWSSTSFRVVRTRIGERNFLGNNVAYPPGGRTGDDCLIATKAMVPLDGPVRTGVGLLGSPSFEIPRTVARDGLLDRDGPDAATRLPAKNRHNAVSMVLHVLARWVALVGVALVTAGVATLDVTGGAAEVVLTEAGSLVLTIVWFTLLERLLSVLSLRTPTGCSIYDPRFWRHERFWKVPAPDLVRVLNGTPFKSVVWRLLGVRVGAGVLDDGVTLTEKTFTTLGRGATLAAGSVIQCHSQEDGAFKSDHVRIGADATLGVGAFVHYGTTVGDAAVLAADSFLMKGEEVPPGERWGGNPARRLPR